ncbi:MAG: hypothetical protein ABTD50_12960 [Polyangiaceae bacterium]|jgi:hypothetical protein
MRLIARVVTILGLTIGSSAFASPSAHLVYSRTTEAAACPDESTLRKAVAARFGYDPFFPQAQQTVLVLVGREHGAFIGRVQLVDEQGFVRGTREMISRGEGCSELFSAVALAISIALDASLNMPTKPSAAVDSQPVEPEPSPPVPWFEPEASDSRPAVPTLRVSDPDRSRWAVGGELAASAGLGPSAGPRVAGFARLIPMLGLPFSATGEVSADWSLPANVHPAGTVTSELYAAALAPCWHFGAGLLCALGQLGWMRASVSDVTSPGSGGTFFAALGARAGAQWRFSERLFVRFHGDLLYDLERPRFSSTSGDATWWDAAATRKPVVGALGLGVGYQIP